ncbi:MAG: RNA polymerase sigma factor [Bacteroidota bacterium]
MDPSDEELMQQLAADRLSAAAELFRRYRDPIFGYLYRRCLGNRQLAEDVLQDCFERVIKYRHGFRSGYSFRSWVFTIARNCHQDRVKRQQLRSKTESDAAFGLPQVGDHSLNRMIATEEADQRREAWKALPGKYREVVDLAWSQGLKYAEIAEVLGLSVANVKVRMHRACKQLKANYHELES